MYQSRVYFTTLIRYHARDTIALRCTHSSPGTHTPAFCIDNRNRTRCGKPDDSLVDNTAPLGSGPTQKHIPWGLDIPGKEYFAAALNHLITVWQGCLTGDAAEPAHKRRHESRGGKHCYAFYPFAQQTYLLTYKNAAHRIFRCRESQGND